ncbi:MAG TPA: hypothetical protein VFV58_22695 [Blastocatellia bacterium]|jgi:hypothetical protein|nr:hypothetical protein [Blastocatellia bacterium]
MRHFSQRIFQCLVVAALLFMAAADAQAQLGGLKKKLPGGGGGSSGGNADLESILNTIDGARLKFAYARISLSIADDVIRRQALSNSAKKSTGGQIEKDKKEIEALDKSIAEKRKLLAELGRQSGGGKYDENTEKQVAFQLKADEEQRAEKKAMVDQEVKDKEANEKGLGQQDRDNYGKLAKLLFTAAKQEQAAVETAKEVQPRAQSAASNLSSDPTAMAGPQPKRLNSGIKNLNEIVTEGPKHAAAMADVAKHLAKIGGVDLTNAKFQAVVVTDEKEVPTNW